MGAKYDRFNKWIESTWIMDDKTFEAAITAGIITLVTTVGIILVVLIFILSMMFVPWGLGPYVVYAAMYYSIFKTIRKNQRG